MNAGKPMETLIAELFAMRTTLHRMHLATQSFAQHVALGELYETIVELADSIAEIYQGQYGKLHMNDIKPQEETDPIKYVASMAQWSQHAKELIDKNDTHLLNEWDAIISAIFRTKYKLEHLR